MPEEIADSRSAARYPAVKSSVYLGWWEEPDYRTCAASLKNLSHGGALVHIAVSPPDSPGLWLCVGGKPPGEWTAVKVVSVEHPHEGLYQVHLKFADVCPYDVFKRAVHGIFDDEGDSDRDR